MFLSSPPGVRRSPSRSSVHRRFRRGRDSGSPTPSRCCRRRSSRVPEPAQLTITTAFDALEFVEPTKDDDIAAAELSNACRRHGVQLATVDALIAAVCISHDLDLLTTDSDFHHAARHIPLRVWRA